MTEPWVFWTVTGGITIVFIVSWFWIKKWINGQDEKWDWLHRRETEEKKVLIEKGGVVTREMYYAWCQQQQGKCPACMGIRSLQDWRNGMGEKGGVMTKGEHTSLCKEITREVSNHFTERIEEMFVHHREWVGQELKIISKETATLVRLVEQQMKGEGGR